MNNPRAISRCTGGKVIRRLFSSVTYCCQLHRRFVSELSAGDVYANRVSHARPARIFIPFTLPASEKRPNYIRRVRRYKRDLNLKEGLLCIFIAKKK